MPAPTRCPCGTGDSYTDCCGRWHAGAAAPTAVALMRSRYTAFALGDAAYLRSTWHRSSRPATLELDGDVQWRRLEIVDSVAGGPFDQDGIVEFRAHHRSGPARGVLHERSTFTREGGRWWYVDGVLVPAGPGQH